jgi:hypothetical protein
MIKKLLLLVILLLGVAMAVPSTREQIQANAVTPVRDAIGSRLVPRRLDAMADQLDARLARADQLPGPDNFSGWLRRDYTGPELDPWDNVWYIQIARRSYTVGSMGPDGQRGTADDITETRDIVVGVR